MIITITGKPCSGKGTVSKIFCQKYNFDYLCTGDMARDYALKFGFDNILDFQKSEKVLEADKLIDEDTARIGRERMNENIMFDSRLAWHFIPNSFKVFIDVDWEIAAKRLLDANRENEKAKNIKHAIQVLKDRWKTENERFYRLYKANNLNLDKYNLIISSNNLPPEEIADLIYKKYLEFMQQA